MCPTHAPPVSLRSKQCYYYVLCISAWLSIEKMARTDFTQMYYFVTIFVSEVREDEKKTKSSLKLKCLPLLSNTCQLPKQLCCESKRMASWKLNSLHFGQQQRRKEETKCYVRIPLIYTDVEVVLYINDRRDNVSMQRARAKCQNTQFRFSLIEKRVQCVTDCRALHFAKRIIAEWCASLSHAERESDYNNSKKKHTKNTGIFCWIYWVEERLPQRSGNDSGAIQYIRLSDTCRDERVTANLQKLLTHFLVRFNFNWIWYFWLRRFAIIHAATFIPISVRRVKRFYDYWLMTHIFTPKCVQYCFNETSTIVRWVDVPRSVHFYTL